MPCAEVCCLILADSRGIVATAYLSSGILPRDCGQLPFALRCGVHGCRRWIGAGGQSIPGQFCAGVCKLAGASWSWGAWVPGRRVVVGRVGAGGMGVLGRGMPESRSPLGVGPIGVVMPRVMT